MPKKHSKIKPEHEQPISKPEKPDANTFIVTLQPRHAEWLQRQSQMMAETMQRTIERIIREAYARDPYKSGPPRVGGSFKAADMAQAVGE